MIENQTRREEHDPLELHPRRTLHREQGKTSWVIVLRGSHPIPPSLRVRVRGLINGTLQEISVPLPDGFTS